MKYTTYLVGDKIITDLLDKVGIEYSLKFIPSSVPCQSKVEIDMKPKNELEALACIGACK